MKVDRGGDNPFGKDTPEWQLFENAVSTSRLIIAYSEDMERLEKKRSDARKKAEAYWAALEKLAGDK